MTGYTCENEGYCGYLQKIGLTHGLGVSTAIMLLSTAIVLPWEIYRATLLFLSLMLIEWGHNMLLYVLHFLCPRSFYENEVGESGDGW